MSRKTKILVSIASLIVIAALVYFIVWLRAVYDKGDPNRDKFAPLQNGQATYDIVVIGEDVKFPKEYSYRRINSVTEANLQTTAEYQFIVINDVSGIVQLSEEEQNLLARKVHNMESCLYYFGTNLFDDFYKNGILKQPVYGDDSGRVYGIQCVFYKKAGFVEEGEWIEDGGIAKNRELIVNSLPSSLLYQFAEVITKNSE